MSEQEVWVPLPVEDDALRRIYQVSNLGRVRSLKRKGWYVLKARTGSPNDHVPYPNVRIKNKKLYVHRLVCRAFHGPAPTGENIVLHQDGNPENCRWDNLRWGSQSSNQIDIMRQRSRLRQHLLTEQEVLQIRALHRQSGWSLTQLAELFKLTPKAIREIISYQTWKHLP
jgi:hypothetical protein